MLSDVGSPIFLIVVLSVSMFCIFGGCYYFLKQRAGPNLGLDPYFTEAALAAEREIHPMNRVRVSPIVFRLRDAITAIPHSPHVTTGLIISDNSIFLDLSIMDNKISSKIKAYG